MCPERFVFVPRDRCSKFSVKSGTGIDKWVEEAEACMRARYLSKADKAFFLFDRLEGEAREEIRNCPNEKRGDSDKIIVIFTGVVRLLSLVRCTPRSIFIQEAARREIPARVFPGLDDSSGEG